MVNKVRRNKPNKNHLRFSLEPFVKISINHQTSSLPEIEAKDSMLEISSHMLHHDKTPDQYSTGLSLNTLSNSESKSAGIKWKPSRDSSTPLANLRPLAE